MLSERTTFFTKYHLFKKRYLSLFQLSAVTQNVAEHAD